MSAADWSPVVASYAAAVATALLVWQVWSWRRSRRATILVRFRTRITSRRRRPYLEVELANIGEIDAQVDQVVIDTLKTVDGLNITQDFETGAQPGVVVEARRSLFARVSADLLESLGNGVDDVFQVRVQLTTGRWISSEKESPSTSFDIDEFMRANGDRVQAENTHELAEKIREYHDNMLLKRALARYEYRGWIEVERYGAAWNQVRTVRFPVMPRDVPRDTLFGHLHDAVAALLNVDGVFPDSVRFGGDVTDASDDDDDSFEALVRRLEHRGVPGVQSEWDEFGLTAFRIDRAVQVEDAEALDLLDGFDTMATEGDFIEWVGANRATVLYSPSGQVEGFLAHDLRRDLKLLLDPSLPGLIRSDSGGWRGVELHYGAGLEPTQDAVEAMDRWLSSPLFDSCVRSGTAMLLRDDDREPIGFRLADGVTFA